MVASHPQNGFATGDPHLQRSPDNLRGICASCHARKTRDEERTYHKAVDEQGYPLDPHHPCYRSTGR